jgi:hypothetical protein
VAGFIVAVIAAVIAWKQYSFMKKERREKNEEMIHPLRPLPY